jgi:hypothetical protein
MLDEVFELMDEIEFLKSTGSWAIRSLIEKREKELALKQLQLKLIDSQINAKHKLDNQNKIEV